MCSHKLINRLGSLCGPDVTATSFLIERQNLKKLTHKRLGINYENFDFLERRFSNALGAIKRKETSKPPRALLTVVKPETLMS